MTQDQCHVTDQGNQFLLSGCTPDETEFLQGFIAIVQKEIETGQLPKDHFQTLDWNEVLGKARAIEVQPDGQIGLAGNDYYSAENPFANPPKPKTAQTFADQPVHIPGVVWLLAIAISVGFACSQRGVGQKIKNTFQAHTPTAKEKARKCYEMIKEQLLKVMP
ncbi:hypothetical protein [Nodosilinea nodulosa]|uniref:hypothetical protein n=1 Tax=Nodosilinea nodulosa TaxID=416001 RepID=UPI0003725F34|nr:hypothetical protein [Nodosilinea nodulosa]